MVQDKIAVSENLLAHELLNRNVHLGQLLLATDWAKGLNPASCYSQRPVDSKGIGKVYRALVPGARKGRFTFYTRLRLECIRITQLDSTNQRWIASLGLGEGRIREAGRQGLIKPVRGDISTDQRGPESVSINDVDTDSGRVKLAASSLAKILIQGNLLVENHRSEYTERMS